MGKITSFINSFKDTKVTTDTGEIDRDRADDYATEKKSTAFYVISIMISVMGALMIWLFAVTTGAGVTEKIFSIQPEIKELATFVSVAEQSGFNVVIDSESTVSFALEGRQKVVNEVTNEDIKVYIDLSSHIGKVDKLPNNVEQILTAEIIIDAPIYFDVQDVSKKEITIKLVPINKVAE